MKHPFIFVFIILTLSLLSCTDILTVKETELSVFDVPNKPYKLRIVYMPSNATIQASVQVRKKYENKEDVLQVYERYNYLKSYQLLGDTALMIVVTDTSRYYYESKRLDTMMVKLK